MLKSADKNKNLLKKKCITIVSLGLLFLGLFVIDGAQAINCDALVDSAAKTKCLQLEDLNKKEDATMDVIDIKKKQANTFQKQLAEIDIKQAKNKTALIDTKKKVEDLNQQIQDLDRDIKEKEKSIKYQQLILSSLLQSYYEYSQNGILAVALAEKDFTELFNQTDYIEQSSSRINEVLKNIRETKIDLQNKYTTVAQKKTGIDAAKKELENENLNLQSNENQKQVLLSRTQGEEQKYQELLEKIREQQREIEQEIQQIESGKAGADLGPLPPAKAGLLAYPVNPIKITQGYGKTSFSKHYVSGMHNGIDFSIKYDNIYAAGGGTVSMTGNNGRYAYGKWVAIDHGDGLVTLYGHLSKQLVSKGDKIKAGAKIGISGNTGYSTGPHLHFSVFAQKTFELTESKIIPGLMIPNGSSMNPKNYL